MMAKKQPSPCAILHTLRVPPIVRVCSESAPIRIVSPRRRATTLVAAAGSTSAVATSPVATHAAILLRRIGESYTRATVGPATLTSEGGQEVCDPKHTEG